MKTQIITAEQEKKFKPITVQITAETIEDARLLFHLHNHAGLSEIIKNDPGYDFKETGYNGNISERLNDIYSNIKKHTFHSL